MIQDNRENEVANSVKNPEAGKQLKTNVGISTPKSVSRPTTSKSTTKSLSTPKNLFSPGPSVNGRDAAKFAKLQGTAERIRKVQSLKEKWAKEKEVSAQVNKEKRAHELRRLQDEADAAAAARKKAIDAERSYELLEKQREKELLAASLEERTQLARDLQEKAKAKRRISMFLNGKLRTAAAKKDAELKAKAQQEYINELSDRRTDYLQLRQAKIREEQGRRDSMMNRTLMAQKHREAEQEMERKAAEEEAALLDMRHLNFQDDMKFKQELDKRRRESMMSRTEMAQKHREAEQAMEKKAADEEAALLETRHLNFQDDAKAKQELEKRRRESMMSRTQMAQKHREAEQEMEKKAADEEAALLEMRHLNFQDDVQFKQELDKRRRDSMMGRTEMARKHREVEQEMERQAAKEEAALLETRQFNFQDDAKARLEEEQQRRMSMAGRLDHWREEKRAAQTEVYATRECEKDLLRSRQLDHQDMQEYKKSLVVRDRQSLAGRLQKWREQKEDPDVKVLAAAVERELQEQELEDVRAYRLKLEQERRESLAYRLEKARKDKTFEAGQTALKAIVEEEERKLADFDRQDVRQYREKLAEDRRRSIQWRNEAEVRPFICCPSHCSISLCA
jgi:hypothetical protein